MVEQSDHLGNMLTISPEMVAVSLAHRSPILAGHDDASGWVLDPISVNEDLLFSTTALYRAIVSAPDEPVVVTSGSLVAESVEDGTLEREYVTGPAREFTVTVDDDFESMSAIVDGTTVTVWYNPGHARGAEDILLNVAPFIGAYPADSQSVAYPDDVVSFEAVYGKGSLAFYTLREHL